MTIATNMKCACGESVRVEFDDEGDPPDAVTCNKCEGTLPSKTIEAPNMWDILVPRSHKIGREHVN
jgi:hypothetical protein